MQKLALNKICFWFCRY